MNLSAFCCAAFNHLSGLARVLKEASSILSLVLDDAGIVDAGGVAIGRALTQNPSLTYLDLTSNKLDQDSALAVSDRPPPLPLRLVPPHELNSLLHAPWIEIVFGGADWELVTRESQHSPASLAAWKQSSGGSRSAATDNRFAHQWGTDNFGPECTVMSFPCAHLFCFQRTEFKYFSCR